MTDSYELIVVGAGQGGGPLAGAFAKAGRNVALVEREHVGGTCVNEGCTPTKTMIASARVAHLARRAGDYGVHTGEVSVDLERVRARKREMVGRFRSGSEGSLEKAGVHLLRGEARFSGEKALEVALDGDTRTLTADTVVLNVGGRPSLPPVAGLEDTPHLNSTTVMELAEVPEHLLVLGGGYVGLEFAQMFRRFGSQVTLIQRGPQLLPKEDADVAEAVTDILREDGVTVLLETEARAVEGTAHGVSLTVRAEGGERTLHGSHLLVATGRVPNSDLLNLAAAGVETDERGYIKVNGRLQTNVPGIYALGDVTGGPAFTHISYDDYRVVRDNLLHGADRTVEGRIVPYTVFIDPQLGRVGLSEGQAREQGFDVKIAKLPMSRVARALETDEPRGVMKAVVDRRTDKLLGAAVLGLEGGEVMSMLHVAMLAGLPVTALRDAPFAYPTLAESLNTLFSSFE